VMWGKLGGSVAALCNIKGLVANFAFRVSSIYVFIHISSRSFINFRFLLIYCSFFFCTIKYYNLFVGQHV